MVTADVVDPGRRILCEVPCGLDFVIQDQAPQEWLAELLQRAIASACVMS
jgi:hypothetical protein